MQIDVATSSVVRRKVKDYAHASHGALRLPRTPQIGFIELNAAALDVSLNVLELPAAQIIDQPNSRAPFEQRFHQVGTDKRCSARNQNATSCPIHITLQKIGFFSSFVEPFDSKRHVLNAVRPVPEKRYLAALRQRVQHVSYRLLQGPGLKSSANRPAASRYPMPELSVKMTGRVNGTAPGPQ